LGESELRKTSQTRYPRSQLVQSQLELARAKGWPKDRARWLENAYVLRHALTRHDTRALGSVAKVFEQAVNKSAAEHGVAAEQMLFEGIPSGRMSIQTAL